MTSFPAGNKQCNDFRLNELAECAATSCLCLIMGQASGVAAGRKEAAGDG